MKYVFHPEAWQEYADTITYYAEISSKLADAFIEAVEKGIDKIVEYPEAWQVVEEDVRRNLVNRFPFGIYYTIEDDYILIIAVMHMSRKPKYWKSRI